MISAINITSLSELIFHIEESLNSLAGPRWFRGCGNIDNTLTPSLMRHPHVINGTADPLEIENRLSARFAQTSSPFLLHRPETKFDWLFIAQHYGVPTRLLDWSENPLIALYFALSSSKKDDVACVWALNPLLWTKRSLNNNNLPRIPDPSDNAAKLFLESLSDALAPRSDPIAIYANHTNPRVVAQRGTFTVFGQGKTPMESLPYAKDCLQCFVIDPSIKNDLYNKLLSIGYTHSVIYPDLSGLGSELKTLFGF